jgi:hypothetical protein
MKTFKELTELHSLKKPITLEHSIVNELGIESDEIFHICEIIGEFELVKIKNQFNQTFVINPKYVK